MTRSGLLPNWIIAGVPKSGTSTLFRWLTDHPQVSGPTEKETYYYVDRDSHMFRADRNFLSGGLAGYERLFATCEQSAKVTIEATPSYMYSKIALAELPNVPTKPRFIFVLREPVAQLRSLFRYFQQNWSWIPRGMTFRNFIEAAEQGTNDFKGNELARNAITNVWYPQHLERWRDRVGSDRMLILLFENLVTDSGAVLRTLAWRLGIDSGFYDTYDFPHENSTYVARSGTLQGLNERLRGRLPKGSLYNFMRSLYRTINTRPVKADERDLDLERKLSEQFAPMIPQLEQDFGLDLTEWRTAAARRGAASISVELGEAERREAPPMQRPLTRSQAHDAWSRRA